MQTLTSLEWFAILLAVTVILYWFLFLRSRTFPKRTSPKPDKLVLACLGDRAQAERLIEYEVSRAPGISREEAKLRAIDRLERDRAS